MLKPVSEATEDCPVYGVCWHSQAINSTMCGVMGYTKMSEAQENVDQLQETFSHTRYFVVKVTDFDNVKGVGSSK